MFVFHKELRIRGQRNEKIRRIKTLELARYKAKTYNLSETLLLGKVFVLFKLGYNTEIRTLGIVMISVFISYIIKEED
ncbi:hypothetical protein DesyoDRAFT_3572 [Desulfosporosinus youngiae DSM 17734]|uniref:Uncharacterized protein n=1 Tax=Desulfosporosinus youngiae DSM 17734 TaxID=768710 RepID=H5Y5I9_9FIRM|nr:hypothetical protein DesyoDRAFT_3572 [Desulfosporosinus youngiae DSM 17734]